MSDTFWGIGTYMHFNIPCSWSDIIIIYIYFFAPVWTRNLHLFIYSFIVGNSVF